MRVLDRLKELEALANIPGTDKTRYIIEALHVLPKLLDLVKATQNTYHGPHSPGDCAICIALKALEKD